MIRFDEVNDRTTWNELVLKNKGLFTQSWQWGEVQKKEGSEVFRFSISRDNNPLGCFALYIKKTPAGNYGYIPRGPAIGDNGLFRNDSREFTKCLKELVENKGVVFLLWEPAVDLDYGDLKITNSRQPRKTILIDLSHSLDDLLHKINKTKRYGIRYAEAHGVRINVSDKRNADFETFWKLMQGTSKRKRFGTFNRPHFENIFNEDISRLFLAEYEGNVDAAAEVIFFADTAVYLHAGTSGKNEKLTASYLLIWEILKAAKNSGLKYFDLWGIDNNRWPGVTAFKESFGGDERIYPEARIIIYKRFRYFVYRFLHLIRRFLAKLSL